MVNRVRPVNQLCTTMIIHVRKKEMEKKRIQQTEEKKSISVMVLHAGCQHSQPGMGADPHGGAP